MRDLDMFLIEEEEKMQGGGRANKQEEEEQKNWDWKQKCFYCSLGYAYLIGFILLEMGYGR